MIIVFYDGKCGLCSKEINYYRRIARPGIFKWHDITLSAEQLNKEGVSLSEGLKFLHAKDREGTMYVGVDAFILIWRQLDRWRILAFIVGMPIIRHIANVAYRIFAKWRFKKLEHCQLAASQDMDKLH